MKGITTLTIKKPVRDVEEIKEEIANEATMIAAIIIEEIDSHDLYLKDSAKYVNLVMIVRNAATAIKQAMNDDAAVNSIKRAVRLSAIQEATIMTIIEGNKGLKRLGPISI